MRLSARSTSAAPACLGLLVLLGIPACSDASSALPASNERRSLSSAGTAKDDDCGISVVSNQELIITDIGVVDDPDRTTWNGDTTDPVSGVWQFGRVMTAMAGAGDPQSFTLRWLQSWLRDTTVNTFNVEARPGITGIIDGWPEDETGAMDLTQAPMRLLAIVNRTDLSDESTAGELRMVYGVLNQDGDPLPFVINIEYQMRLDDRTRKQWAKDWHLLGELTLGSEEYNATLQTLTDRVTGVNATSTDANFGGTLGQLRTNEVALGVLWEQREFHLESTGLLTLASLALTPAASFDGTGILGRYMEENETEILANTHSVPATYGGRAFRAGALEYETGDWQSADPVDGELRHQFSINTCSGCHGAETDTHFLHVDTRDAGLESELSGFLKGIEVVDPVDGVTVRTFGELDRRNAAFVSTLCTE